MRLAALFLLLCATVHSGLQAQIFPAFGGERTGVSLASALKIGAGARAAAMGEAVVAITDDATSVYWNPAGMTQINKNQASFTFTRWFGGLDHQNASAIWRIDDESALGLGMNLLSAGNIPVTTEFKPMGTGQTFTYRALALGLSYARQFTEQFSAGLTVRYLDEMYGVAGLKGLLFDAGTYYKTGLGTSRFAVAVSNFGSKLSPTGLMPTGGTAPNFNGGSNSSFQSFDPPINFRIGFAMDPILDEEERLTMALQLNHPNDNSENYAVGAEYSRRFTEAFPARLLLRAGYKINTNEENFSMGGGMHIPVSGNEFILQVEYAYANFSTLGGIHRFTAGMAF
jgi:hypothetical protein